MSYYNKLQTKQILNNIINTNISYDFLIKLLKHCYNNVSFSTLPYFINNYSSFNSITKLNSGNCVALSLYLQIILKKYNIISYLIPASIPNIYKKHNLLELSHVALAIPINKNNIYILDPAFYFYEPILYTLDDITQQFIKSANIYLDTDLTIQIHNFKLDNILILNKYQTIPKHTPYSECNYINNLNDTWRYYIIEIINPDQAISTFYINNAKLFLTTTKYINNKLCMDIYLKFEHNNLNIKINNQIYFNDIINNLTKNNINYLNRILRKYLNTDIITYFSNIKIKHIYNILD